MSFQYSAIGDNTPENREHLEKLGYTMSMVTMDKAIYLKTQANRKYYETNNDDWSKVITNCIGNPLLFQAVTAVRDDSDFMQWFVFDKDVYDMEDEYTQGDTLLFKKGDWYLCKHYGMIGKTVTQKATFAELINHFKHV